MPSKDRKDDAEDDWIARSFRDPYFFEPLYVAYRRIIHYCGEWPDETIPGLELYQFTTAHDALRQLVTWNFLAIPTEHERPAYQPMISVADWEIPYKITKQTRSFVILELDNAVQLGQAILILLRADLHPMTRKGIVYDTTRAIGFYELVMFLNKPEEKILAALKRLEGLGLLTLKLTYTEGGRIWHFGRPIDITEQGLHYLERGGTVAFNNINITNSTVGVVALQSTLTNIDASIGNIRNSGNQELANALSKMTETATNADLSENQKKDVLGQIELLSEQAQKPENERRPAIAKAAYSLLNTIATTVDSLSKIWIVCGPIISSFFGITST